MHSQPPKQNKHKPKLFARIWAGKNTKKAARSLMVMVAFILVLLVFAWVISLAGKGANKGDNSLVFSSSAQGGQSSATSTQQPASEADWNQPGPVQRSGEATQLTSPDYRMIALPENGRVDMSYFNTVTFVGDSITQGFALYTKTLPAKYCAYKSIGPKGIYDGSTWKNQDGVEEIPMDAIVASAPDNVYILIGANAIGNNTNEAFVQYYTEMLSKMRAALLPAVKFYIQSITPVRPDSKFDQNRINEINNLLAQLAFQQGVYFVNLNEVLAGDDGYLKEEYAGADGIHMLAPGYSAWLDYLVTHTAYDIKNPYLEGSPAYTVTP